VNTSITSTSSYCKGIIPDRLKLEKGKENYLADRGYFWGIEDGSKWADGTPIENDKISFEEGYLEGQNINHAYSNSARRGFNYNYHNKIINPDGSIKADLYYLIGLEIDLQDKTDNGYKVVSYNCKSFKPIFQ